MTLAVTLLHRSIVSNAYSCGWSRCWKNSVVDVELQVRGSVNTLTQVHSALAGCDVRNLWLLDKVTCVQPSSPPELSPSPSPPFSSPEFQSCLPSTPLNQYSSSPCSSPFQHHQPFWLSSLSPCLSPKKSKLSASSVDSDETKLALSPSPLPSPTLSVDSDETRLALSPSPLPILISSVDSDETRLALSPSPLPSPTLSVDSDETRLALSPSALPILISSVDSDETRLALSPSLYDSDETTILPPTPRQTQHNFSPELFDSPILSPFPSPRSLFL